MVNHGCPVRGCVFTTPNFDDLKVHFNVTHIEEDDNGDLTHKCPFGCEHEEKNLFIHFMKCALVEFTNDYGEIELDDGYSHLAHCVAFGFAEPYSELSYRLSMFIADPRREEVMRPLNHARNQRRDLLNEIRSLREPD